TGPTASSWSGASPCRGRWWRRQAATDLWTQVRERNDAYSVRTCIREAGGEHHNKRRWWLALGLSRESHDLHGGGFDWAGTQLHLDRGPLAGACLDYRVDL